MNNVSQIGREKCVGCGACKSACAFSCISWEESDDLFRYPRVDRAVCRNCGKCLGVCPVYHDIALNTPQDGYAAYLKNNGAYRNSTSGGAFTGLAEYVVEQMGGYVCGAVMEPDLTLHHVLTDNLGDIARMQGSKYVQSNLEDCFEKIRELVKKERSVLFCGTGCQTAALKCYCGDSEFLFTLDLICHGVPSASAFKQYINRFYTGNPVDGVTFREKNRYESTTYALSIQDSAGKKMWAHCSQDPFYSAFLSGASYRESCYGCRFARKERCGDITIGDCANSAEYASALDGKVLSTVFINTAQGQKLWNKAKHKFKYIRADIDSEVRLNRQLHEPMQRPAQRDLFYRDITLLDKRLLVQKYCPKEKIKVRIRKFLIFLIPADTRTNIKKLLRRNR
ncbi:MAG TPA: Coenzyme F420 hydrogenase/dehydrogenase, beta subunit C-terminal domain [Caproiciproducens sp.]|nr:Coenzyme F420 hydrogenase/dehydrogenase, beta subunit C-terminal domain [Caproiciproducens sp.]